MSHGLQGFIVATEAKILLEEVRALARMTAPHEIRNVLMALQADVQKLVDEVAANASLAKSAEAASKVMSSKIDDLNAKLDSLTAGQVISAEDLTAIKQAAVDLKDTNDGLAAAVPANTPAEAPPPATTPETSPPA